jgi:peptide/nickel transport system substrate-binding protein
MKFHIGWKPFAIVGACLALTLALGGPASAKDKDTLVIALPIDIPIPDAHKATGLPAIGSDAQVGDLLVLQQGGKVIPWLAESWESADGGKSLIFKIRDGVKSHDGTTVSADDVKWSIDRFRQKSIGRSSLALVKEVSVLPGNRVKVTTAEPFAPLLRTFSYAPITVYSRKAWEAAGSDDAFSRHPVGPGPFKFVEWIPGQHMLLEAFPDYWNGAPKVKRVEIRTILDEASRIAALEAGEVDVIHAFSPVEANRLEKNANLKVYNPPSAGFIRLNLNTHNPPFNDVRVRQAIAYGIDKEAFSKQLFLGTAPVAHSLVPSEALGYTADFDVYKYNPEKAKELLKEAGVPNLSFTFSYGSGRYLLDSEVVALLQAQLARIGVNVKVQSMEWAQFSAFIRQPPEANKTEMILVWWRTVNGDPDSAIGVFTKKEMPKAGNNTTLYVSNEFERLYAAQQTETDPDKRLKDIRDLQQVLMHDLPAIPMYNQPQFWASRANVENFAEVITPLSTPNPLYRVSIR